MTTPRSTTPPTSAAPDADAFATPRACFDAHVSRIRRLIHGIAGRRGVRGDERDDFEQYVMLKLLERDCAILGRFRGNSSIDTYLTVVIQRLLLDFRNQRWGRWRPSVAARRLGPVAVQLERMTHRDGRSVQEAIATLRLDARVMEGEEALERLAAALPIREKRRFESDAQLETMPAVETADVRTMTRERRTQTLRLRAALVASLLTLSEENRLLVHLRYLEGMTVSQIARVFELEPKPLYRHFDRQLVAVREALAARGITWEEASDVVRTGGAELGCDPGWMSLR